MPFSYLNSLWKPQIKTSSSSKRKFGEDLSEALLAQSDSPLGYGSEFKPIEMLELIFENHPSWSRMKRILTHGLSKWPLQPLDKENRIKDVEDALNFGNHKGANKQQELLEKLVRFCHPFSTQQSYSNPGNSPSSSQHPSAEYHQQTRRVHSKNRLTYDQSWKWQSGTSVKSRVNKDELMPFYFGRALRQLINWAVAARKLYPNKRILAMKLDVKKAYRRCHLNVAIAVQTCTQIPSEGLALLMLRLTFGGAPCPSEWGAIAESICDLANAILLNDEWNHVSLQSPAQYLVPNKIILDDNIPFGIGRDLVVDIPVNPRGTIDLYINDYCGLTVDIGDNAIRLKRAPLLALGSTAREVATTEPLPRDDIEARNKLVAEAGLTEIKTFLGWLIDFRRMTIALPDNKFKAYSLAISEMLKRGCTSHGEMETNIGRWVHLGQIVPTVHHFLSRLCLLKQRAENRRQISINEQCKEDLRFLLFVLGKCREGIDLNLIAFRRPTHVYRSDSCPAGLGCYSHKGFVWRFYLLDYL
jgi:hypothetical protein